MPIRKRVIQIAGISAAAGFAVVTSPGTAHASGHNTESETYKVTKTSGHTDILESKYGASSAAGGFNGIGVNMGGGSFNGIGVNLGGGSFSGIGVNLGGGDSGVVETKTTKVVQKGKKDCGPKKVKVTKPVVVEKPKVVVVEKEAPAPAPAPMPVIHIEQSQTQTQTQTEAPKTVVLAAAPAAPVVQSAQLAKTGVETWHLAGLGSGLIGLGVAMEAASRKRRTAGKVEVKGATEIAALGEKFEDKNKLVLPLVDIDANTAAWPVMVQA